MSRTRVAAVSGAAALLTAGCSDAGGVPTGSSSGGVHASAVFPRSDVQAASRTGKCRPESATFATAQPLSSSLVERARVASGAAVLRVLAPGKSYTLEHRADRLNLRVDRRGRVVEATCG
jgi:hypothetical protein